MKITTILSLVAGISFCIPAYSEEGGGGESKQQVSIDQLPSISPRLHQGLQSNFETCAQKILGNSMSCTLGNMGTTRDPNAKWGAKNSCHKNRPADAVDIGDVHCGGMSMGPKDPRFAELAQCMANGLNSAPMRAFLRSKSTWRETASESWGRTGLAHMAEMGSGSLHNMLSARQIPFVKFAKDVMLLAAYGFDNMGASSPNSNALRIIYGNGTQSIGNLIGDHSGKHDDHIHAMVPGCSYNGGGGESKYDYKGNYDEEGRDPDEGDST